jgi:hypothetical protein
VHEGGVEVGASSLKDARDRLIAEIQGSRDVSFAGRDPEAAVTEDVPLAGSVERLLALSAAGDYRDLYSSLLAALPKCMGECGRTSRFMTTYSSQFSCGRAECEQPDANGDRWIAAQWKDHVDAAEARAASLAVEQSPSPAKCVGCGATDRPLLVDRYGGGKVCPCCWSP